MATFSLVVSKKMTAWDEGEYDNLQVASQRDHNVRTRDVFIERDGKECTVIDMATRYDGKCIYALRDCKTGMIWPNCALPLSVWERIKDEGPYYVELSEKYANKETGDVWEVTGRSLYKGHLSCVLSNCKTGEFKYWNYLKKSDWDKLNADEDPHRLRKGQQHEENK